VATRAGGHRLDDDLLVVIIAVLAGLSAALGPAQPTGHPATDAIVLGLGTGLIVLIGSVAGRQPYPNAALYVTSKYAVRGFAYALREDLLGRPIRITTVDPGLVETDFSRVRFRGDEEKARAVYSGVEAISPDEIAECILFALTRPPHVNVDELVVKALMQSSGGRILRRDD